METVKPNTFLPGFKLECFANRDSTVYKKLYGIPEVSTILRGTLRFEGFASSMKALHKLHLIDPNPHPILNSKGPDLTWVLAYRYLEVHIYRDLCH
jgi:alpha-aminoadipic semialdehyde synthase